MDDIGDHLGQLFDAVSKTVHEQSIAHNLRDTDVIGVVSAYLVAYARGVGYSYDALLHVLKDVDVRIIIEPEGKPN